MGLTQDARLLAAAALLLGVRCIRGPTSASTPRRPCEASYVVPLWPRPTGGLYTASEAITYLPIAVLTGVAMLLVFLTLAGNKFLGPKRANVGKISSYECGEQATPGARGPIDVQYYMFVLTFLIFDVEAMFLIPFALKFKEDLVTLSMVFAVAVFVGLILWGYLYEIRKKLLDWRPLE